MMKSASTGKAKARENITPYIPFVKDRVHLSQDAIEARAMNEPALSVHKRNPHTTYLSEIESFIDMINIVTAAQQASRAQEAAAPVKPAPVKAAAKAGAKSKSKPPSRAGFKQPTLRQPATRR